MENNGIKNSVEEDLKEVRKCKLDILILQRQNEELCQKNNAEITRLTTVIEDRLFQAEDNLKLSGKRKIDTSVGWVAYREMPDSWEYDVPVFLNWCHEKNKPYYHLIETEILDKMKLKKCIQEGILKIEEVNGLKVTPQEPKFNYRLNGGVL
jgi:hypothetical protein